MLVFATLAWAAPARPAWAGKRVSELVAAPRRDPVLELAAGPLVGPHAMGNESCRTTPPECVSAGRFIGLGVDAELRVRLYRLLRLHGRGFIVANAAPDKRLYAGLYGAGLGLGVYGKLAMLRGEVLLELPFGSNQIEAPFTTQIAGSARWTKVAGMLSAGVRLPLHRRVNAELWAGWVVGPRETRVLQDVEESRILQSFMVGLSVAVSLFEGRSRR